MLHRNHHTHLIPLWETCRLQDPRSALKSKGSEINYAVTHTSVRSQSTPWIAVPFTTNKLSTPSPPALVSNRYLSNSGSQAFPDAASHTTSQSRKWPAAVLRRMLSPVEFTALSGRMRRMEPCGD